MNKSKKKKQDLLEQRVSAGLTKPDKEAMRQLKQDYEMSYASLIREALYAHYPKYFTRRTDSCLR